MTLAAPPVTQLALALVLPDGSPVIVDAPTARERLDLMTELRAVWIGDVWVSGEYRVERDDPDGVDTVRFMRGSHLRGEWAVTSANKLAAALRAIHVELVGAGITCGWLLPGKLYVKDKPDCSESLCDEPAEEMAYNGVKVQYAQEALVVVPLRIEVFGFDDDEVTLRDGTISVIQEGSPFKVSGSRSFVRDPRLSRLNPAQTTRAIQRGARIGLPYMSAPAHLKWCSDHPTAKFVDPRLLVNDPVAYWEQRGFVPRSTFEDSPILANGKPKYRDGKKPVCKECRNRHERMMYHALKIEQGQPVRPYNRRTDARPRATARRAVA